MSGGPCTDRMLALVLRPTAPPLWLGVCGRRGVHHRQKPCWFSGLREIAPDNAFGALFLLGVLVVSAGWGFWFAVATSLASAMVYVYFHMETDGALVPTARRTRWRSSSFLPVALLANVLAGQARLRAAEAEQRRREADSAPSSRG